MDIRKELRRKIERKLHEIEEWKREMREREMCVREGEAYIVALEETLKLLPKQAPADSGAALRADSALAKAREAILKAGGPLHINDLLTAIGKPVNHNTKAGLAGSLSDYVHKQHVFTRPAPNTFGLIELEQQGTDTRSGDELPPQFGFVTEDRKSA